MSAYKQPDDYVDVAARIVEFREKHPEGCLRPADLDEPFRIQQVGDKTFVVVVAAAYRTPDDPMPGVGMAWEPFPGPTPFTRDSELQNAETSAWGRAIVAALAADTRRGIATSEDVRARQDVSPQSPQSPKKKPSQSGPSPKKKVDLPKPPALQTPDQDTAAARAAASKAVAALELLPDEVRGALNAMYDVDSVDQLDARRAWQLSAALQHEEKQKAFVARAIQVKAAQQSWDTPEGDASA